MKSISLSIPNLAGNEQKYVDECITTGWVSSVGSYVTEFEHKIAEYIGVDEVVAVASGTAALHLCYLEAGLQPNDLVIVPSITFIATVNPIRYCGADPLFVDVDDTLGIDPKKLEHFLETECHVTNDQTIHTATNRVIRAIGIVHIFGNLSHIIEIKEIVKKYPMLIVEDAAEAIGTKLLNGGTEQFAGTFGDFGVFSFNGNKIITTGGGGAVICKDKKHLQHIRHISTQAKSNAWYFYHDEIGYNYRLTNIAAALGVAQLEELEGFIHIKEQLYMTYANIFQDNGITMLPFRDDTRSNRWFFTILWEDSFGCSRDELLLKLKEKNIECRPVWGLIHEQQPYLNCIHDDMEKSLYYKTRIVNIPCSTSLDIEEAVYVANTIVKIKNGEVE